MGIAGLRLLTTIVVAAAATAATADPTAHLYEKPVVSNRDPNMNRQVSRGSVGAGGGGGGTAMANSVVVNQQGRGHTLILNVTQTNSGDITAGTSLNGRLRLD